MLKKSFLYSMYYRYTYTQLQQAILHYPPACSENLSTLSDVAASANGSETDDFDNRRTPSNLSDAVSILTTGEPHAHMLEERRNIPNLPITVSHAYILLYRLTLFYM